MDWLPDDIRAKADALRERGPGRITLTAETLQLLLDALNVHAAVLAKPRLDAFVVEGWSGSEHERGAPVAEASDFYAAQGAFDAYCVAHPKHLVTLRQGCRILKVRRSSVVEF